MTLISQETKPPAIAELDQGEESINDEDKPQAAENYGKTTHDSSQDVEESELAQDQGGETDHNQKEVRGHIIMGVIRQNAKCSINLSVKWLVFFYKVFVLKPSENSFYKVMLENEIKSQI